MFFDGLTRMGGKAEPELALARSVEISADLKTYTFVISDASWSNGEAVLASDFVYAYRRALSPSFTSSYASQLYCIKNGRQIKEGTLPPDQLGVQAINDKTLVIQLEYPIPYFLKLLTMPIYFPVCEKTDRAFPHWMQKTEQFVCNGPFCPTSWQHASSLKVQKNGRYWDADHVGLQGVEFAMVEGNTELSLYEKKQLHWAGSPLSTLPVDALNDLRQKGVLRRQPILGTCFIRTNTEKEALDNPLVRRALALAISRKDLTDYVLAGEQIPATGLVPPELFQEKRVYFADGKMEEAKALIAQVFTEQDSFPKLTLTYSANERNRQLAQALQDQWRKALGIEVALEGIEPKVYYDRIGKQDFDLALGSWMADFEDPINFLELFKHKTSGTNNTLWEDPTYRDLLSASFQSSSPEERLKLLAQSEAILIEQMPIIPLYHYTMLYLQDQQLEGVVISSLGGLDFKWAMLQGEGK
jgi:oligopeptide transport system substrate-binding protein